MTEQQANYWYPKEKGEQHELVPKLQANVIHPSFITKFIDNLPTLFKTIITLSFVLYTLKMLFTKDMFTVYGTLHVICILIITLLLVCYIAYKKATTKEVYLYDFAIAEMGEEYQLPVEKTVDYCREAIG